MKRSVNAPAKINLSLDVLGKRDDGYHEVKMVMTQVDLSDRLDLQRRGDGLIKVEMSEGFLPADQRNLAYQAAALLKQRFSVTWGVSIYIYKNIPVAAGLAGGSSDAAAALKGLNDLWELGLSMDELAVLGAELGSDVPFCVYGGTALATGRGELIEQIPSPPPCWVILAKPPVGVSTGDVYKQLKIDENQASHSDLMVEAIYHNDYAHICHSLYNALEQVTLSIHPEISRIKERMRGSGADAAMMSGSGPTVFGLIKKEAKLNRVYNALRGFCDQVYAVRLISEKEA
ncbi:4-(cytidine 5'-diphospho)-2-C-methyl-D-erythritol kinase [Salibacterium salarium]|uniref:4-diphosphocytidyl-2-C-methyl-D-erythritol kinase n=1 Tax=Salibacterium salarium TaxID=284579 RepID=A0A3R9QNR8_9BACI|nr:4-(cytidine 5'-diphospho)-2-C-methyl-D-erythritol kinase [Salibacterium salarium]RSL30032.1 4-(cytidine 5'-diphospho)-2-C-methyl-D-erythritol kinase [Salibacterium salarium]